MDVTVIGHAGLYIEAAGTSLLVDPWLSGSCYWRSWWHFPPSPEPEPQWLAPRHLYLTHHHFDHFHYPSLRRLDRSTRVYIPRFGNDVMPAELAAIGFTDVVEMPHGRTLTVVPGLELTSFQYGFDDSALVVRGPDALVVDLNDCKLRSDELRRLAERFGRPDLMLKSHSWAQGYPHCYRAEDEADLQLLSRDDYVADFIDSAKALRPRDAAPFASMVCFLHPETFGRNSTVVTPPEVAAGLRRAPVPGTEVVLMKPGDTWHHDRPFTGDLGDYYSERDSWLARLAEERAPVIARSLAEERSVELRPAAVEAYFSAFVRAVPRPARLLVRRPIVFKVRGEDLFFVLRWRERRATVQAAPPEDYGSLIEVPAAVLAAAVENRIVHFVHISMRFQGEIRAGGVTGEFALWTLLGLYELGYLPARRLLTRRFASVCWRRRHELWALARTALVSRGSMAARMTSRFMARDEPTPVG